MNYSKTILLIIGIIQSYFICSAQGSNSLNGIQWTTGLSWENVKQKAKTENKYILVDAYATWCKPCKIMDMDVFSLDSVGEFYNSRFLSVKVQMDVTKNDNSEVQVWREDANKLQQQYEVGAFPTYLFFSPEGVLVDKREGAVSPSQFIKWGRNALTPGLVYKDPNERYKRLIADYKNGVKEYDSLYSIAKLAAQRREEIAGVIIKDIYEFLKTLPEKELYRKDRLQFIEFITVTTSSKWFNLFYKNGEKLNKVMDDNHYAQRVVDYIILREIVNPFLKVNYGGGTILGSSRRIKADLTEANWDGLEMELSKQFDAATVKRNLLSSKFMWYKNHWNYIAFSKTYYKYLRRYGIGSHSWTGSGKVNDRSWEVFQNVDDRAILRKGTKLMRPIVNANLQGINFLDTYACMLYKSGQKRKAILWEEKALAIARDKNYRVALFQSTLDRMKRGEKLDWFD